MTLLKNCFALFRKTNLCSDEKAMLIGSIKK